MTTCSAGGGALARIHGGPAGGQGPGQHGGRRPLGRSQAHVAAREGQAVGLAHDGTADDLDGQREVEGHAPHHGQLLEVLEAEVGPAGAGDGEQLGHHGGHAVEVARARGALPALAHARPPSTVVAGGSGQVGYISATEGTKTRSAPAPAQAGRSVVEGARVVGDVVGVAELERVDEDAHDHHVALGPGPRHEREVAGVQRAHGGHEADGAAGGPGLVQPGSAGGAGLDDLHGRYATTGTAEPASRVARAAPAW